MKKISTTLLIILLLINCTSKNYKEKLIGEWYWQENPTVSLIFTHDSLFFNTIKQTKSTWTADESNIYTQNITDLYLGKRNEKKLNTHFIYYLSKNKDTLSWGAEKDTTNTIYKLIRIKNQFEHFQKTIGLKIDLPKSKKTLVSSANSGYNIEIHIGFKEGQLISVIESEFVNLKNEAYNAAFRLFAQLPDKIKLKDLKFVLIADKNVSGTEMDSIKSILRELPVKIFRIYRNDTIDYKTNLNWYGLYE